ncbi:MAG: hypothetical protein ACKV19_21450 [Verrucomicrobiales bacterium]
MPAFDTPIYETQLAALSNGATRADVNSTARKLHVAAINYKLKGTEATNDTLNVIKLPKGAQVVPGLSYVHCDDPGTTLTVSVGVSGAATKYSTAMTLSSGGLVRFTPGVVDPENLAAMTDILATLASVDTPTAGADLWFVLAYTLPQ